MKQAKFYVGLRSYLFFHINEYFLLPRQIEKSKPWAPVYSLLNFRGTSYLSILFETS